MGVSTPPKRVGGAAGGESAPRARLGVVAAAFFDLGFVIGGIADEPPPARDAERRVAAVETKAAAIRARIDGEASR